MKTNHIFKPNKLKIALIKADLSMKKQIWEEIIEDCQKIVNSKSLNQQNIDRAKEIQEVIRSIFLSEYLNTVHKHRWTENLNNFLSEEKTCCQNFINHGHECKIFLDKINVVHENKTLAEIDHPSVYQLIKNFNLEDQEDDSFFVFCIMNMDENFLNKLYRIYGFKEYQRILSA